MIRSRTAGFDVSRLRASHRRDLQKDHAERPFCFITVVTDSISVCSAWFRAPSDLFIAANKPTAKVIVDGGVERCRVLPIGFPVSPQFALERPAPLEVPTKDERRKLFSSSTRENEGGPLD